MYSNAVSEIECGNTFEADSISGMSTIKTKSLHVNRFYKSLSTNQKSFTKIQAEELKKCLIESGNFDIELTGAVNGRPVLGNLFKGKI